MTAVDRSSLMQVYFRQSLLLCVHNLSNFVSLHYACLGLHTHQQCVRVAFLQLLGQLMLFSVYLG